MLSFLIGWSENSEKAYWKTMGCSSSIERHQRRVNPDPIDIPLSKAQKYLVRETWETVEQHKNSVGKQTFLR